LLHVAIAAGHAEIASLLQQSLAPTAAVIESPQDTAKKDWRFLFRAAFTTPDPPPLPWPVIVPSGIIFLAVFILLYILLTR
jgi:hypothetical protein